MSLGFWSHCLCLKGGSRKSHRPSRDWCMDDRVNLLDRNETKAQEMTSDPSLSLAKPHRLTGSHVPIACSHFTVTSPSCFSFLDILDLNEWLPNHCAPTACPPQHLPALSASLVRCRVKETDWTILSAPQPSPRSVPGMHWLHTKEQLIGVKPGPGTQPVI